MKNNIFTKCIRCVPIIGLIFVSLYIISCVSVTWEEEHISDFPFFEGAQLYAHIADKNIVGVLAEIQGITDSKFVSLIDTLSISTFGSSVVIVMSVGKANFYKKYQMMSHLNAVSLEDTHRYWSVEFENTLFLVDIGYANTLIVANKMSLEQFKQLEVIQSVPKTARALNVNPTDSFWLWSNVDFFRQFLSLIKIGDGSGALRIPKYLTDKDVKTSIALPYNGARSDLATLKLTLPFLFRSIEADILGSLPEVRFASGIVTVKGLQLPAKTIKLFLDIVATLSIIE